MRTCDLLRRSLAEVVQPHGITLQQYNVLRILRGAGPAGLPTLEIGARMIEEAPGITRLLDRLEARRLVRRVLCRITRSGLKLLEELGGPMTRASDAFFSPLAGLQTRRLIRLLDDVRSPLSIGGHSR